MVKLTCVIFSLSLSTSFFLETGARDLSSRGHPHHRHIKRLSHADSQEPEAIKKFESSYGVILEDRDVNKLEARAPAASLAPIRGGGGSGSGSGSNPGSGVKCEDLGIPALDDALIAKVKTNLENTGWDSWVSGTR